MSKPNDAIEIIHREVGGPVSRIEGIQSAIDSIGSSDNSSFNGFNITTGR
jgi:hypothetical protein